MNGEFIDASIKCSLSSTRSAEEDFKFNLISF